MDEQEIDLLDLWEAIKKRWLIVVAIPLIAALTSGVVSFYIIKPVYQASTTLIVGKKASDNILNAGQLLEYNELMANKQLAKTYEEIAKSRTVETKVIEGLDLDLTPEKLDNKITVSSVKDTEVLEIAVQDQDPALAADIANTMAKEFSDSVIEIKKVDSVSIIDEAIVPTNPIKPDKLMNIAIAFVVGLMASLGVALLLEFLDKTIKTTKDVEDILGLPVLGVIPQYEADEA